MPFCGLETEYEEIISAFIIHRIYISIFLLDRKQNNMVCVSNRNIDMRSKEKSTMFLTEKRVIAGSINDN